MKRTKMDLAIFWLPVVGGILLGTIAAGEWYSGNRVLAVWFGFAGAVLFLFVLALQIQQAIQTSKTAGLDPQRFERDRTRAYVSLLEVSARSLIDQHTRIIQEIVVAPVFRNSGVTPARKATCWHVMTIRPASDNPNEITFGIQGVAATAFVDLAPTDKVSCVPFRIQAAQLISAWSHKERIFLWARVEYDVPEMPRRHVEYCAEAELAVDPTAPIDTSAGVPEILRFRVIRPDHNSSD